MWKRIRYQGAKVEKAVDSAVVRKLRAFLDAEEPKLVYWLVNLQQAQGNAITYKEIREAILAGEVKAEWIAEWQQDYVKFVKEHLEPAWTKAIETAAKETERKYPLYSFDPAGDGVQQWVETRAADYVTSSTTAQIEGLRAVIRRAAVLEDLNVDMLARAIRPMVGLYAAQATANFKYYQKLLESGVKDKRALDLAIRYGARQHRYRGYLIARQELAMAYNTGADQAIRQAQEQGLMGETVKVVSCAMDERVCSVCGSLEGAVVGMDEDFKIPDRGTYKFTERHPPFHIGCRCAVEYKEIAPPIKR